MTTINTHHHGKYNVGINTIVYQRYLRPADERQDMLVYEVMIDYYGMKAPVGEYDEYQIRSVIHDLRAAIATEAPTFDMPVLIPDRSFPTRDDLRELLEAIACLSY